MHFYVPPWLRHGRARSPVSIFSVDIEPHGQRLASAGQDCAVKIWSLPVLAALAIPAHAENSRDVKADSPAAADVPPPDALLASISSHSSAVNCVRWAPAGNLLASGGDDAVVLIYEQIPGAPQNSAFAAGGKAALENWTVRRPLRGHTGDVTDVCWSPDGQRLASASVDNAIYVWSVRNERAIVRLDGHCGLVKGVAWDPVDRFLASQSDDKTVRIWRTSDWKTEKVISKPFDLAVYKENSMAFFLRISWSPCGSQLTATNAYKKPSAHYAPMLSRESGFDDQLDFIGHREPVVTSRFSPRLYRATDTIIAMDKQIEESAKQKNATPATTTPPPNKNDRDPYTCLALGSKDCGASIWRATRIRPFFDIADMFDADVIDLSWGTDGYTLMSCSTDGRVMYVRFEPDELGEVVSQEETRTILAKQWRVFGGAGDSVAPIPESAAQLQFEHDRRHAMNLNNPVPPNQQGAPTTVPKPTPLPPRKPLSNSSTPIVLDDSMDVVEETIDSEVHRSAQKPPVPPFSQTQPSAPSSDKRGMLPAPVVAAAAAVRENGPTPPADPRIIAAQAEVRVRGGKRRITPMAVTAVAQENNIGVNNAPTDIQRAGMDSDAESAPGAESPWKRSKGNPFSGGPDVSRDAASNAATAHIANGVRPSAGHVPNGGMRRSKRGAGDIMDSRGMPVRHAADLYAPSIVGLSMMLLPNRGDGPGRCRVISDETPRIVLESREQHSSGGGYEVMCSKGGKVQWRDYHPKSAPVTAIAGVGGKFAAVGTGDGMLFLYSAISGRRLAPPISIDSAPYMLEAMCISPDSSVTTSQGTEKEKEKWFVVLVSRSALCTVFDVKAKKLICARSAASLLATPQDSPAGGKQDSTGAKAKIIREVALCQVTAAGEPILLLSDGHAFVYSTAFCAWLRVADDSAPNSEYVRTIPSTKKVGLLRSLQPSVGRVRKGLSTLSGMSDLQRSAVESLAHLESLMESAIVLRSASDYRYYLTNYASRIAAAVSDDVENCTVRLRELCDQFLNLANPREDNTILGMSCRSLLKDTVLPVIAANRQMQRFVAEYVEILTEVEKKDKLLKVDT
ncbi:unnamed protein product [Chondrus crispus]|uniref:Protein HIRA n=1 Tax=Chondrus crispus TaxID=2769 RepID=R7QH42_CHOCR|nr:unnamed protein product [Chondrus crispus]CDF37842.1 unnamed protein product [Chondrus crispus]|eukprot:XP_005717713.1 unnamed protein product [Chondrus crispus]